MSSSHAADDDRGSAPSEASPRLYALGGRPGPADLASDLAQLAELPEAARAPFEELLQMNLGREVGEASGQAARRFGEAFGVPRETLVRLVRACRLLLRSAAMGDVPVDRITVDLNVLCGEEPAVVQQISAWYARALPRIRSREVLETLPDFGAVLQDVRVRKGYVPTSRHTPDLVTPLSAMTISYLEHGQTKHLTLQLSGPALALLRARCDELL